MIVWVGHIVLCSHVETAIGCVASSIPTLRRMFNRSQEKDITGPSSAQGSKSLITFGSKPIRRLGSRARDAFHNPTDTGSSVAAVHSQGRWESLEDGNSDKEDVLNEESHPRGIRAEYTYSVELSQSPKHANPPT